MGTALDPPDDAVRRLLVAAALCFAVGSACVTMRAMNARRFRDRSDAGRALAKALQDYAGSDDVVVLGLPRGGVPVAAEVARGLGAPLDVMLVRKLGVPGHEELAMGAVAGGGVRVLNEGLVRRLGLTPQEFDRVVAREEAEVARREAAYRGDRARPDLAGKVVILVDDGLATGATMRAAVEAVQLERPARLVVAVPTGAEESCADLRPLVDHLVCLATPHPFYAVGLWYDDFTPTTDDEVRSLLSRPGERFEEP
jgi:putative phosphoribosyl transferase